MPQYYIENSGVKEGPHDLVTVMRRIRARKIVPDTGIYVDDAPTPTPAGQLTDTAIFFDRGPAAESMASRPARLPGLRLSALLRDGWRFTSENSIMTVFAGGMLLLAILVAAGMVTVMGQVLGGMLAWLVFVMFNYLYLVCCLRMYRGQPFSEKFWTQQLSPVLTMLLFAAIVIGMMMVGGAMLLIAPGVLVAVYYVFVPFFIVDRQMSVVEAMHASRLLVRKHRGSYQANMAALMLFHVVCLLLIVPAPVSMPVFAAALARFFEELSAA